MAFNPSNPLPDTQEGVLQAILIGLNTYLQSMPRVDPATKGLNVRTINGFQPAGGNGTSAQLGTGVGVVSVMRVTPATDGIAGQAPLTSKVSQGINAAGLINLYSAIQVR